MIAVAEKYAIEVNTPVPITSERQHQEYVSVLDKLAAKRIQRMRKRSTPKS